MFIRINAAELTAEQSQYGLLDSQSAELGNKLKKHFFIRVAQTRQRVAKCIIQWEERASKENIVIIEIWLL